jgi:hypothetical protein
MEGWQGPRPRRMTRGPHSGPPTRTGSMSAPNPSRRQTRTAAPLPLYDRHTAGDDDHGRSRLPANSTLGSTLYGHPIQRPRLVTTCSPTAQPLGRSPTTAKSARTERRLAHPSHPANADSAGTWDAYHPAGDSLWPPLDAPHLRGTIRGVRVDPRHPLATVGRWRAVFDPQRRRSPSAEGEFTHPDTLFTYVW